MKRSRILLILAVISLGTLRVASGCAAQGEGQLCSTLNNMNSDCSAGLVCVPKFSGSLGACCPMPPAISTQPACISNSTTVGTGGGGGSGGSSTGGSTTTSSTSTTSSSTSSTSTTSTTSTTSPEDAGTDGDSGMLDGGADDGGDGGDGG